MGVSVTDDAGYGDVSGVLAPLEYGENQMREETRVSSSNQSNLLADHIGEGDGFLAVICPFATSTNPSIAGRVELIQNDAHLSLEAAGCKRRHRRFDVIRDFVNIYAQQGFAGIRRVLAASGLFTATKH